MLNRLIMLFSICFCNVQAQYLSKKIGDNSTIMNPSAVLEVESITKGFLPPRMTQAQMNAIVSPAIGLIVYCTDCTPGGLRVFDGTIWVDLSNGMTNIANVVVTCNTNGFEGIYTNGIGMTTSNKFLVTVTNNSFTPATIDFQTSDLVLSGVSGITVSSVSISSVTLNPGQSQVVEYTLSGTPTSVGTLKGTWTKLALTCVNTVSVVNPSIASLGCSNATHNGTLINGTIASGVSSVIGYTGGDGSAYSGQTVNSTGVIGLTATLASGNFASGSGSLTYTISGIPSSSGIASFEINIGRQSCILSISVNPFITPTTITLAQNRTFMIGSVYDQDYLPYTSPNSAATTTAIAANGINEAVIINIQGSITTSGINVTIPVTATASGTLPAYSNTITVPASLTEDGISRNLTFSWLAQAYTSTTTSINATIKALGGTFNAKKLDINAGVGNDALGILLGQFTYPFNNTGNTTNFNLRVISGIPDKMFGLADNNGNTTTHMMLYLPIMAEDGNYWLNNNLGAHYANMNHPNFNFSQQATSVTDHLAYGSMFQWGRRADGHELITYTNSTTATSDNSIIYTRSDVPAHASFILGSSDWRVSPNVALWSAESSPNNPCPFGFRVPNILELSSLVSVARITNRAIAFNSLLKFTVPGRRDNVGVFFALVGSDGNYWSSSTGSGVSSRQLFTSTSSGTGGNHRAFGLSVRCLKN